MEATQLPPPKISITALLACAYRAIGAKNPDPLTRNPDGLAEKLIGRSDIISRLGLTLDFDEAMARIRQRSSRPFFFVQARTRHIDAVLARELDSGAAQVVVLGAGFDTRARRFSPDFPEVRFFELDRPPTQETKRRLTAASLGPAPPTLTYVPIDFNTESIGQALERSGYDNRARTVFIWEGVSYYLEAAAAQETLSAIAKNSAPGGSVIFDYLIKREGGGRADLSPEEERTKERLNAVGEPFRFGLPAGGVEEFVARCGLEIESDLGPEDLTRQYLINGDGSVFGELPIYFHLMHARVPQ
jgi:methyltransferase (TIGR00027 family)